jgi:hypothetical protein
MAADPAAEAFHAVVQAVAGMQGDGAAAGPLAQLGLQVLHVTWEDSARYKGSAVGPNISDMTIQVQSRHRGQRYLTCMPVIRFPNFGDRSCDLPIESMLLRVGNERGEALQTVDLRAYLGDLRRFLTRGDSWAGAGRSLLAARDSHVLVSAQACFLPVPRAGIATFTPVIFNYQSRVGQPAVLAIVATREGTSATVIDNQRDAFAFAGSHGQRLLFNKAGERAPFTGQRASDVLAPGAGGGDGAGDRAAALAASAVLLIQVPLKYAAATRFAPMDAMGMELERGISGVEPAVIGHGAVEGRFTEIDGLAIERDERFPIRVTVQFYKATCDGAPDEDAIVEIGAQIERVYADAKMVGSLVDAGETGRATEWDDGGAGKQEPPGWWGAFWRAYAAEHGLSLSESYEAWFRRQRPFPGSAEALLRAIDGMFPRG